MKLYGIINCNTVRKARNWLGDHQIEAPFRDFKKQGVCEELLGSWLKQVAWEKLDNRQSATWRQLPDEVRVAVTNEAAATRLMLQNPV